MNLQWWANVAQILQAVAVIPTVAYAARQLYLQKMATIITWVQAEDIRKARAQLYQLERDHKISTIPGDQWRTEWEEPADRVSQAMNSAAMLANDSPDVTDKWVKPTAPMIKDCWQIVEPRFRFRRRQIPGIWDQFEELAKRLDDQ